MIDYDADTLKTAIGYAEFFGDPSNQKELEEINEFIQSRFPGPYFLVWSEHTPPSIKIAFKSEKEKMLFRLVYGDIDEPPSTCFID